MVAEPGFLSKGGIRIPAFEGKCLSGRFIFAPDQNRGALAPVLRFMAAFIFTCPNTNMNVQDWLGRGGRLSPFVLSIERSIPFRERRVQYRQIRIIHSAGASAMPRFLFQLNQGKPSDVIEMAFESDEAARQGAMALCADRGRDIFADLAPGCEWQMNVMNERGNAIFQVRLYAWILD
ncbi:DUF6894 family protein [Bradyrhizobium sp.]|uniref:DUF6894 family protein n=1 Tax=Bradyrhizobium sp. TaxID=376 RepID=UPI003C31C551